MKNLFQFKKYLLLINLFLFPSFAHADRISNFDSQIEVHPRGAIRVQETIHYDFEQNPAHGITRNIPEQFEGQIEILSITDERGTPYFYQDEGAYDPTEARLKIGDPKIEITGKHTFIVTYSIANEIRFLDDHDEIYWNVTGNDWGIPIKKASTTILLPKIKNTDSIQTKCYTGFFGENFQNCKFEMHQEIDQTTIEFETTQPLVANEYYTNENLTVVIGIPKKILNPPLEWTTKNVGTTQKTEFETLIHESLTIVAAIALFLFAFLTWLKKGNDPTAKNPVIAIYEPPDKLSAAEMDTLWNNGLTEKSIVATIFELGVKGILKIVDKNENTRQKNKSDLALILKKSPAKNELNPFQNYVYKKIFDNGKPTERRIAMMKHELSDYGDQGKTILKTLKEKGYYETEPGNKFSFFFFILGAIGIFLSWFMIDWQIQTWWTMLAAGIGTLFLSFFMTKKTSKGVETDAALKGFKWFLEVTEKDRLKFHNPPAQSLELFEKMLPYAVVFGLETKWIESFESTFLKATQKNPIPWLFASPGKVNSIFVNQFLKNFKKATKQTTAARPARRAGSSSGFSGGFSGGGGGGGGGGRW